MNASQLLFETHQAASEYANGFSRAFYGRKDSPRLLIGFSRESGRYFVTPSKEFETARNAAWQALLGHEAHQTSLAASGI